MNDKILKEMFVIVPIHEYTDEMNELLSRAISSIPQGMETCIILNKDNQENIEKINALCKEKLNSYVICALPNSNSDNSNTFSEMINHAVSLYNDESFKYFSILEFDDVYTDIWFKNIVEQIEDKPDVSVYLPLTEIIDYNNNRFISYGNEAPWASSFSEEIGYIDNDSLQQYFDFYLTGSVFNLKDWKYVGELKVSMKLTFWYEFLLRLTHNDKKAFVIPKLIYKHYVNRPNSLYMQYKETISEDEGRWWYDLALEEYRYKKDRKKVYTKVEED